MKIILATLLAITLVNTSYAQEEQNEDEQKGKFRVDNIFIGGSIGLSIGGYSGGFNVGANPEIGYSITRWLDAGISTNVNYFSYSAQYNNGVRQRSTTLGGGIFTRIFPVHNFFVELLPEYNKINTKLTYMNYTPNINEKYKQDAPSLLAGVGYGSRVIGGSSFFTVIMIDLGNNRNSPYINSYGSKLPIIRSGFNFYLRPKKQR